MLDDEKIFDLILETVLCKNKSIVVASSEYPAELVRSKFLKLNMFHVEYAMDCMRKNTSKIHNIKKYLLAALFNAPSTISGYYQAEVTMICRSMPQMINNNWLFDQHLGNKSEKRRTHKMLKIFAKLIVLPVMVILIALSFTVSILSKIHYLAAVLVNAIFIMCAVIALSLQQWQNFGIAVFVLAVSCMILKLWDIIEYAIGVICGHLFEILSV